MLVEAEVDGWLSLFRSLSIAVCSEEERGAELNSETVSELERDWLGGIEVAVDSWLELEVYAPDDRVGLDSAPSEYVKTDSGDVGLGP